MITLQIAVDVLMDLTTVHSRAPGDPRASHRDSIVMKSTHIIQKYTKVSTYKAVLLDYVWIGKQRKRN